jgi:hypothetical protein
MQSKRFDGNAVLAILGILREQNRFRPDKIVVVNGLEPGGEVLGETIAQPDSSNHFKTAGGDAPAAWVRVEGSCKLRLAPRGA